MLRGRRSLLVAIAAGAALAAPAAASAAPVVAGTAVVGMPQDCQAGCIGSLEVACAATDPLSVRTTVRCWTENSWNALSATQAGPAAVVKGREHNQILGSFTLCVQGIARYANGTTATTTRCADSDGIAGAVVG